MGDNGLIIVYGICFGEVLFDNGFEREFGGLFGFGFYPPNVDIVSSVG